MLRVLKIHLKFTILLKTENGNSRCWYRVEFTGLLQPTG